uniref:Beta/alpha-defensin C-terminal domain-containing protein n=1 Tax=Theropithecus gelada TaxID=9565 RepID=A0A8D2F826_THEGE
MGRLSYRENIFLCPLVKLLEPREEPMGVFLISFVSSVSGDIRNPVTCIRSGAICYPRSCPGSYKHIGVCGVSVIKCCKKP